MAQHLREPLFVFDADRNDDAHVHMYYYKDYAVHEEDTHETGCGRPLSDPEVKRILVQYAKLHVMPVCMVLRRQEGHFYGVYHGEQYIRWQAEGDSEWLQDTCSNMEWADEVLTHNKYAAAKLDSLNPMEDSDLANALLIGGLPRRERLNVIFRRLRMTMLDSEHHDMADLEQQLVKEEQHILRAAGLIVQQPAGFTEGKGTASPGTQPTWIARASHKISYHGRVGEQVYDRILRAPDGEPRILADRTKMRLLHQENDDAVAGWLQRLQLRQKSTAALAQGRGLMGLFPWLLDHRAELHELFNYLPYPELAAKSVPLRSLRKWGQLVIYAGQLAELRRLLETQNQPSKAGTFCSEWLQACTADNGSEPDRILVGDPVRWARYVALRPEVESFARPAGIPLACWELLHVLPHTVWVWRGSPMGANTPTVWARHFRDHPSVRMFCEEVTTHNDWGGALRLQSGVTWEDRLNALERGQTIPRHY